MDLKTAICQALYMFCIEEQRPHNPLVLGSNPSGPTKQLVSLDFTICWFFRRHADRKNNTTQNAMR